MYTDLDRADIVSTDPKTGKMACHQTDHRSRQEIEAEPELSTLFAMIRIRNGRLAVAAQALDPTAVDALYVALDSPPDFLARAVYAVGGRLTTALDDEVVYSGPPVVAADLADEAFGGLAERIRARFDVEGIDEGLLKLLEAEAGGGSQADDGASDDDDSDGSDDDGSDDDDGEDRIAHFTHLVELCAVAGEVLRAQHGGRWVLDTSTSPGILPFLFRLDGDGGSYDIGSKAQRFLASGPQQSLTQLLRIAEDSPLEAAQTGTPLLSLKAPSWPGRDEVVCRPILDKAPQMGVEVPLVAYGWDLPSTFALLQRNSAAGKAANLDALHAAAVANLPAIEVKVETLQIRKLKLVAVSNSYFAAEKLLDPAFMRSLGKRLGSGLLAAAVPKKGLLLVTSALVDVELMTSFMAICAGYHRDASQQEALSPVPFLVGEDGSVQGVVRAQGSDDQVPPPKKKGLFSRMFGKN